MFIWGAVAKEPAKEISHKASASCVWSITLKLSEFLILYPLILTIFQSCELNVIEAEVWTENCYYRPNYKGFLNRTLSISVPLTINYTLDLLIFQDSHAFYQSGFTAEMWPEIYYQEDEYYSCYDSWLTVCVSFSGLCSTACRLTCALTGIIFASKCFLSLVLLFPLCF